MHGINLTTQMDIFYHAMNYASEGIIYASYCGAFKRRNVKEARQLIEDLSKCNYKAPSEASGSSNRLKGSGLIELNRMISIEAKLDAITNKLGSNERRMHISLEVGSVDEGERKKSAEARPNHEGSYQVEEAQYLNANKSYTFKPTSTCPLTIHRHSGTMRISHMVEEHSKIKDLDRICNNIMPYLGSNNNNNNSKQDKEQKIRGRGDLIPLRTKCLPS